MIRAESRRLGGRSRPTEQHVRARGRAVVLCALFLVSLAMPAAAQLSGIQGTVTDDSPGVLPGVVVRAGHVDTGTSQETVTDADGRYFFQGLRIGAYELVAQLPGFATLTRQGVTVSVGQIATIDLLMQLATLQETIIVTADSPLVNLVESKIGGNLNVRQMEEAPINGRQWTQMTNLAPGARGAGSNTSWALGNAPSFGSGTSRTKINVDGGTVNTGKNSTGANVDFSQYTIEEVEVLSNRFGAQYARAGGGVLNAITKSGTNTVTGQFYGFFRDDALNAVDFFTNTVRPIQNRQLGGLIGGPIKESKAFYFVSWESERQPQTYFVDSGVPVLDERTYPADSSRDVGLVKINYQISTSQRLTGSTALTQYRRGVTNPVDHISSGNTTPGYSYAPLLSHVWTFGSNKLNTILAQYTHFNRPIMPALYHIRGTLDGESTFPFLNLGEADIGAPGTAIADNREKFLQLKEDFSIITGEHTLAVGGEYLYTNVYGWYEPSSLGRYNFRGNPTDWPAVVEVVEAGDRAGLQRLVDTGVLPQPTNFVQGVGNPSSEVNLSTWGAYLQDDWRVNSRLTLNLGLRYDIEVGALRADYTTRFLSGPELAGRPNSDTDNWQPRFGFVFALDGQSRTLLRGGAGRYYDQTYSNQFNQPMEQQDGDKYFTANVFNDGSADFMINPLVKYGGANCNSALLVSLPDQPDCVAGLIDSGLSTDLRAVVPWWEVNYTDQYAIGVQHQLTDSLAFQADIVHARGEDESYLRDTNLWVDCGGGQIGTYLAGCIGETLPVREFGRPDPRFARTRVAHSDGYSRYNALQVNVSKRFSQRHQYEISYILSTTDSTNGSVFDAGLPPSAQYGTSAIDERHRLTALGQVQLPWDTQFSAVIFASSGFAYRLTSGRDNDGDLSFNDRALADDGSKLGINAGRGDKIFRVDVRLAKRVRVHDDVQLEGIIEVFNLFNRENYIRYQGNQRSSRFGVPRPTDNLLYQPRTGQLAFRVLF